MREESRTTLHAKKTKLKLECDLRLDHYIQVYVPMEQHLLAFSLEVGLGCELRSQKWEADVWSLHHLGPVKRLKVLLIYIISKLVSKFICVWFHGFKHICISYITTLFPSQNRHPVWQKTTCQNSQIQEKRGGQNTTCWTLHNDQVSLVWFMIYLWVIYNNSFF